MVNACRTQVSRDLLVQIQSGPSLAAHILLLITALYRHLTVHVSSLRLVVLTTLRVPGNSALLSPTHR